MIAYSGFAESLESRQFTPARLIELLQQPSHIAPAGVEGEFDLWARVIDSLVVTTADYCFARNWLDAARASWHRGELAPARYQLVTISKRLGLSKSAPPGSPVPNVQGS